MQSVGRAHDRSADKMNDSYKKQIQSAQTQDDLAFCEGPLKDALPSN